MTTSGAKLPSTVKITISGLTKRYESGRGIEDIDLEVPTGQIVALLGPNGAGKTTTVRCLTGLLRPDRGTLAIGASPAGSDEAKRATAYIPDNADLFGVLSVEEHVRFRALAFGVAGDLDAAVERALAEIDMLELADQPAGELSRGQRQRVMIAAALVQDASAYVFDEPTTGLDPVGQEWIEHWMVHTAEAGAAVLLASHNLDVVARVAAHAVLLINGRVTRRSDIPLDGDGRERWRADVLSLYAT